jgi:predicted nuclease of predicted toxin-antitoxin system
MGALVLLATGVLCWTGRNNGISRNMVVHTKNDIDITCLRLMIGVPSKIGWFGNANVSITQMFACMTLEN